MEKFALPVASSDAVASAVLPSMNVTLPPGIPPGEVTVAESVTLCPKVDGLGDTASVAVVEAGATVWLKALDTLALKLELLA